MFDLAGFLQNALLGATGITPVVFMLVTMYGKFGLSGQRQLFASLATGLLFGGSYAVVVLKPSSPETWLGALIFTLLMGGTATGCYEGIKNATAKGYEAAMRRMQ